MAKYILVFLSLLLSTKAFSAEEVLIRLNYLIARCPKTLDERCKYSSKSVEEILLPLKKTSPSGFYGELEKVIEKEGIGSKFYMRLDKSTNKVKPQYFILASLEGKDGPLSITSVPLDDLADLDLVVALELAKDEKDPKIAKMVSVGITSPEKKPKADLGQLLK